MLTHKLGAFLAWIGLFIVPATTADYLKKPLDIHCKPYKMHLQQGSDTVLKSAISLDVKPLDEDFGGFSSVVFSKQAKNLYLLTDRARLLLAQISWDDYKISCLKNAVMMPLRGNSTRPLVGHYSDSEGLSWADKAHHILVSFERDARVVEYDLSAKQLNPVYTYKVFSDKKIPYSTAYETVRLSHKGNIFAIPEYYPDEKTGAYPLYMYDKKQDKKITYWLQPDNGFYITDMAQLHNGDFVILERDFSVFVGFSTQIRHLKQQDLQKAMTPHNAASARVIMRTSSNEGGDNFEAIAVRPALRGDYIYLISDNNFTSLQNTVVVSLFYPHKHF